MRKVVLGVPSPLSRKITDAQVGLMSKEGSDRGCTKVGTLEDGVKIDRWLGASKSSSSGSTSTRSSSSGSTCTMSSRLGGAVGSSSSGRICGSTCTRSSRLKGAIQRSSSTRNGGAGAGRSGTSREGASGVSGT